MSEKIGDLYIDAEIRETIGEEIDRAVAQVEAGAKKIDRIHGEATIDLAGLHEIEAKLKRAKMLLTKFEGEKATAEADVDIAEADRKIRQVKRMIKQLQGQRASIQIDVDNARAEAQLASTEAHVRRLNRMRARINVDVDKDGKVSRAIGVLERGAAGLERGVGKAGEALGNIGVIAGPFATSFANFGRALVTVGPLIITIVTNIVAALSSLVGVLAAGIGGAAVLAVSALGSFAAGAAGIFAVVKPLIGDLQEVAKSQKQYNEAVNRYGKDSKEAKNKMERINNVFKGTAKGTKEAWLSLKDLGNELKHLTTDKERVRFFDTIAEGIKTAKALLPTFATGARSAFKAATDAVQPLLKALRSDEGKSTLAAFFQGFSAIIGPITSGIGALVGALARIGTAALPYLERGAQAFENWALGILEATGNATTLDGVINDLVSAFKSVINFIGSAANLAAAFFGRGADEGQNMIDSLAESMDNAASYIRDHPDALKNFFQDGAQFARDVANATQMVATAMGHIAAGVNGFMEPIRSAVTWLGKARDMLGKLGDIVPPIPGLKQFTDIIPGLSGVKTAIEGIKGAFSAVDKMASGFGKGFGQGIKASVDVALGAVSGLLGVLAKVGGVLPGKVNPFKGLVSGIKDAQRDIDKYRESLRKPVTTNVKAEGAAKAKKDMENVAKAADGLPKLKKTRTEASNAASTKAQLDRIAKAVGAIPRTKRTNLSAQDGITAKANSAATAVASIPTRWLTVWNMTRQGAAPPALGKSPPGGARGAVMTAATAERGRGAIVDRPTFITGEEYKREYVIATNPAYKERNKFLVKMAARDLGMQAFAQGGVVGGGKFGVGGDKYAYGAKLDLYKVPKPQNYSKNAGFQLKGKNRKPLKTVKSSPFVAFIERLQTQEEQIRREISIRQSGVQEPTTFLTETKDPATGESVYEINQAAIDAYHKQLEPIFQAEDALVQVIKQEIENLPRAMEEAANLRSNAAKNVARMKHDRLIANKRLEAEQKKDKKKQSSKKISNLKHYINDLDKEITRQEGIHGDADSDLTDLRKREPNAGFEYREAVMDRNSTSAEMGALQGKAGSELSDRTANNGRGGTGANGTTPDQDLVSQRAESIGRAVIMSGQITNAINGVFNDSSVNRLLAEDGIVVSAAAGAARQGLLGGGSATRSSAAGSAGGLGPSSAGLGAGPGGAGTVGGQSGATVVQNNYMLSPSDPGVLLAVGDAAAAGFGLQGFPVSTRLATGY